MTGLYKYALGRIAITRSSFSKVTPTRNESDYYQFNHSYVEGEQSPPLTSEQLSAPVGSQSAVCPSGQIAGDISTTANDSCMTANVGAFQVCTHLMTINTA